MAVDIYSSTWNEVTAFCEKRVASARKTLEAKGCDQRAADECRAIIAILTELQGLPDQKPLPVIQSADY